MKNPIENDPSGNPRLQALIAELTQQINLLFSDSYRIKEILVRLDEEGYQVDSLIASLSPTSSDGEEEGDAEEGDSNDKEAADFRDLNRYDQAFLQTIKVRP